MWRKALVLLLTVLTMPLVGGLYGALHDQLSYTISPEYFTHFKYHQFGFEPSWFGGHRPTVAVIGFLASWWVGAFIGVVLGLVCLRFRTARWMLRMLLRGTLMTLCIAAVSALAGLLYAQVELALAGLPQRNFPLGVTDPEAFHSVGTMHLFSYEGGVLGLLVAVLYLFRQSRTEGGPMRAWHLGLVPRLLHTPRSR